MNSSSVRDVLGVEWLVSHSGTESGTDGAPRELTVSATNAAGVMFAVEVFELGKCGGAREFDGWMIDFVISSGGRVTSSSSHALEVRGCSLRSLLLRVSELCKITRGASRVGSNVHQLRSVLRLAFQRAEDSLYAVKVESLRRAVRAFDGLPASVADTSSAYRLNAVTVREVCHQELKTAAACNCVGFCSCEFVCAYDRDASTIVPGAAPAWDTLGIFPAVFAGVKSPGDLVASVLESGWECWSWWQDADYGDEFADMDAPVLYVVGDHPENGEEWDDDPARPCVEQRLTGWDILRALALWWRKRESTMDAGDVERFRRGHLLGWSGGDFDLDLDSCDGDAVVQIAVYGEIVYA